MRMVVLLVMAVAVFGCGGGESKTPPTATTMSEESRVRAEYARYLDILDERQKWVMERDRDRDKPRIDASMKLGELIKAGAHQSEIDAAHAKVKEIEDEKTRYIIEHGERRPNPPHPLDAKIAEAYNKAAAIRREYQNRWKSLGIDVE